MASSTVNFNNGDYFNFFTTVNDKTMMDFFINLSADKFFDLFCVACNNWV